LKALFPWFRWPNEPAKTGGIDAQEILDLKRRLNEIYVRHTGQPLKKIEDALERDYFLTAETARDFGIVDKVIEKRLIQSADAA